MRKQLISFETVRLSKEKGCTLEKCTCGGYLDCICEDKRITQSLLQKWLRKKYNIHANPIPNFQTDWGQYHLGIVFKNNKSQVDMMILEDEDGRNKLFDSYEQALEKGLIAALKLIENES